MYNKKQLELDEIEYNEQTKVTQWYQMYVIKYGFDIDLNYDLITKHPHVLDEFFKFHFTDINIEN